MGSDFSLFIEDRVTQTDNSSQPSISYYVGRDKKYRYKVTLRLGGASIFFVDRVIYHLHETFTPPQRTIERSVINPNCELAIWTWGLFTVRAEVFLKDGRCIWLSHFLTYDEEIERGKSKDSNIRFFDTGSYDKG